MLKLILGIISSYLIGAIPFAYLFGRICKGIDIRKYGSGNVGATNAFRVLGPILGIAALLCDISKGFICPTLIANYAVNTIDSSWVLSFRILLGVSAVCGHNWTLFLRFKGGKGVATSLGVIIGLAIIIAPLRIIILLTLVSWVLIFLGTGFVSLASISAACLFPILNITFNTPKELLALSLGLCLFIILRHKSNIYRLLHKQESRFYPLKSLKTRLLAGWRWFGNL
ncbi:MAG TPA: glycerol-3-phosphate 1-O-acyltransferase [Candidatus Omnitrophica bacterium]|nr:glycerol-3-phosphate 1-O-acyltransferase [Candidatus Omnitrophota bacterium]